jgi:Glycine zipper
MQKRLLATAAVVAWAAAATAQVAQPPPQSAPTPRPPTLAEIGMFVYPAQGQSPDQMAKDQGACTRWAESQTGLQLQAGSVDTQAAAKAAEKQAGEATEGAAVLGAAKGAAAGTAIGAIAGDTGKGAAIGAVAGAMGGVRARRHAKHEAGVQGAQKAQAQNQQALDTFKKAAGACLEGRGYSVK